MATFTPISFTANTKIKSADVNGNFTQIQTILNAGIVDANVASGAAIARTKLGTGTLGHVGINDPTTGLLSDYGVANTVQAKWLPLASQGSDPATPPSGAVLLYNKNKKLYTINDAGAITQVGAGSNSAINYVTNSDAEVDTSGWATYSSNVTATITIASPAVITVPSTAGYNIGDPVAFTTTGFLPTGLSPIANYVISAIPSGTTFRVAQFIGGSDINTSGTQSGVHNVGVGRPLTGSGGTATATFIRSTSSPLRGTASFQFTTGKIGDGVGYAFTIDPADKAKVLNISFDYNLSSAIQDGDYSVWIYDVTNSTRIQPAPYQLLNLSSSLNGKFTGTFQTASNSTSYRLCFHQSQVSAVNVMIDNVQVGPQVIEYGAPVTDWQSFAPTGSWNTNTTYTGFRRRVGDSEEYQIKVLVTGAPNSATLTINLPVTIDTTKIPSTSAQDVLFGFGTYGRSGTDNYGDVVVGYSSTTAVQPLYTIVSGSSAAGAQLNERAITQAAPNTWATGDFIEVSFRVPVLGYGSSLVMSNDTDTRVVALAATGTTGTSLATGVSSDIVFNTVSKDTHGAYSNVTGVYTIPVAGWYEIDSQWYSTTSCTSCFVGRQFTISVVKNGATLRSSPQLVQGTTVSDQISARITCKEYFQAGDLVKIQGYQDVNAATAMVLSAGTTNNWLSIARVSGPNAIAASEFVSARYKTSAGQTITSATFTGVVFDTKEVDSHGAFNPATGVFTCPTPGTYQVRSLVTQGSSSSMTAGNQLILQLSKSGSLAQYMVIKHVEVTASRNWSITGATSVKCLAGDTLAVDYYQDRGTSLTLTTDANACWVEINRIGN